jgi:hypothetical protein
MSESALQLAYDRIKRLEEALMNAKNKHAALVADVALYEDRGERIKRLEEQAWKRNQVNNKQTINTMMEYGGSFVRKLGAAALVADSDNLAKIKTTWPDYWAQKLSEVEKQASK